MSENFVFLKKTDIQTCLCSECQKNYTTTLINYSQNYSPTLNYDYLTFPRELLTSRTRSRSHNEENINELSLAPSCFSDDDDLSLKSHTIEIKTAALNRLKNESRLRSQSVGAVNEIGTMDNLSECQKVKRFVPFPLTCYEQKIRLIFN